MGKQIRKRSRRSRVKWWQSTTLINALIILILALTILASAGCSPQRRLERLIENNPQLLQNDTIQIHDTIIIPEVSVDTIVDIQAKRS